MEGAAAYQQLRTPQDGLSRTSQYLTDIEARKRTSEEREKNRSLGVHDTQVNKESDLFSGSVSGNRSLDEIWMKMAGDAQSKYLNYKRQERDLISKGRMNESRVFNEKALNILSSFKRTKQVTDQIGKNVEDYIKAFKEGKVNPLDKRYPMIRSRDGPETS